MALNLKKLILEHGIVTLAKSGAWTPLSPTTDGGLLPHTFICPALGLTNYFYQDSAKTTPAAADGDPVGAVVNRGTDTYDIIQNTTTAKPTLKLNILNSQPVLRSDGGDSLQGAFAGGDVSQPTTMIAVIKHDTGAGGSSIAVDGDENTKRQALFKQSGDDLAIFSGSAVAGDPIGTDWMIATGLFNGASSELWRNGVNEGSGNAGNGVMDGLTLFSAHNAASLWLGDIAMVVYYDANLSDADKNQIGQWASSLYGISYTDI